MSLCSTPDNQSNGMEYSFTCFRKMSDRCSLAAKADGKVDTKLTAYPPVVTLGMDLYGVSFANMRLCLRVLVDWMSWCDVMWFGVVAGGWMLGSNYLQAFVNSQKEWGMAYKVKVSDAASLNLGVSSFLNKDQRMATQFGYKLQV